MANNDYAVFILTHGRPDKVVTLKTLRSQGYTGRVYFIVDNEDKTADQYKSRFGNDVIVFDKAAVEDNHDTADNFGERRTIFHARNACFDIAESLGVEYFLQLDDDYSAFVYKFDAKFKYIEKKVKNLDRLFDAVFAYYKKTPALAIALAQNGDFIGGKNNKGMGGQLRPHRKCMNTFFCSTSRHFNYLGTFNEDVNTYTTLGRRGNLFLTIPNVAIIQAQTQHTPGGITEAYKRFGTYVKAFYTVMHNPSSVKVSQVGYLHKRIHHKINWSHTVPQIIPEDVARPVGSGGDA